MGDITSANAVLTIGVGTIIPSVQLQGFAVDDIYDVPSIKSAETMMGVDGVLSGGFVYVAIPQKIVLQADSLSNAIFDQWWTAMQANQASYSANGLIKLPSILTKFTMSTGFLTGYKPVPAGKKVLQPRDYEITWQNIAPAPTS
jgi:hypothetical protein